MRCSKCGAELSEDTKFCSYCGNKVEMPPKQETVSEEDIPPISLDEQEQDFQTQKEPPKSLADRMKEKVSAKWGKLSTYGKIATVAIVVFALLFIVALLSGKTAAIIIAVLQIALSVEEYNAMVSQIEELNKEVEFYKDTVNVLLEDIEDFKKEIMGPERYARATELSDEAIELMNRSKPNTKLFDLRTQKVAEE